MTLLVCSQFTLDRARTDLGRTGKFAARMAAGGSPEDRAAEAEARSHGVGANTLATAGRGVTLPRLAVGIAGVAWEYWR